MTATPVATYASAYAAHYTAKDPGGALDLYQQLIDEHPSSTEAQYARSQIVNIAKSVIPEQQHLLALLKLARSFIGQPAVDSQDEVRGPWSSYTGQHQTSGQHE